MCSLSLFIRLLKVCSYEHNHFISSLQTSLNETHLCETVSQYIRLNIIWACRLNILKGMILICGRLYIVSCMRQSHTRLSHFNYTRRSHTRLSHDFNYSNCYYYFTNKKLFYSLIDPQYFTTTLSIFFKNHAQKI